MPWKLALLIRQADVRCILQRNEHHLTIPLPTCYQQEVHPPVEIPQRIQVQEDGGDTHGKSIFLALKGFLALGGPGGDTYRTFVMVTPEPGLLPLAPATSC